MRQAGPGSARWLKRAMPRRAWECFFIFRATTRPVARKTGGVNASTGPRRKTAARRPRLDRSALNETGTCASYLIGSDTDRTCDAGRAITSQDAWEAFVDNGEAHVCPQISQKASELEPHLGCGPWIGVSGAFAVEGDTEQAAVTAAALRTVLRRDEIAGANTCWITLPEGSEAADVFPAIASAVGRPRPRGENVHAWTKDAVHRTGTRLVVLAEFDRALRGRGVGTLTESALEYLVKDQQTTEYVLLGDGLCEKLVKRNKFLGYYLTRLHIGELVAKRHPRGQ